MRQLIESLETIAAVLVEKSEGASTQDAVDKASKVLSVSLKDMQVTATKLTDRAKKAKGSEPVTKYLDLVTDYKDAAKGVMEIMAVIRPKVSKFLDAKSRVPVSAKAPEMGRTLNSAIQAWTASMDAYSEFLSKYKTMLQALVAEDMQEVLATAKSTTMAFSDFVLNYAAFTDFLDTAMKSAGDQTGIDHVMGARTPEVLRLAKDAFEKVKGDTTLAVMLALEVLSDVNAETARRRVQPILSKYSKSVSQESSDLVIDLSSEIGSKLKWGIVEAAAFFYELLKQAKIAEADKAVENVAATFETQGVFAPLS